jgi:hypothetical protein
MDDDLKQNLTASETWIRGFFILLFVFLLVIARVVTGAVVVIQFLFTVFTGQTNENLRYFGASLASFIYQTLLFVTYNSDDKPFPFSPWPTPAPIPATAEYSEFSAPAEETESTAEALEDTASNNDEPDEHEPRS